jgi:hypothetical protein
MSEVSPPVLNRTHLSRLMKVWRSAGWPCRDPIELDLLAAGLLETTQSAMGHETLKLTPRGMAALTASRQRNLKAMTRHDRLVQRVARQLTQGGRLVWTELSLRAQVRTETGPAPAEPGPDHAAPALWTQADLDDGLAQPPAPEPKEPKGAWRMARPDVFSVRHTSVADYLQPVVHEIKVSRADLLSDLRHAAKRESYQWLCSACYYVFPAGIAQANELPSDLGVWVVHGDLETGRLEQLRPARHAPCELPFPVWMSLAKATPWRDEDQAEAQGLLMDQDEPVARLA